MKSILFIGPCPRTKNTDPNIPFAGTKSANVIMDWIYYMNLYQYNLMFINVSNRINSKDFTVDEILTLHHITLPHTIRLSYNIIAFGDQVSNVLKFDKIEHFKLPHPSGRNRQLNDQKFINNRLDLCKQYLGI